MAAKIQDGRHEIQFFDISTSDGGDFPRIVDVAMLFIIIHRFTNEIPAKICVQW